MNKNLSVIIFLLVLSLIIGIFYLGFFPISPVVSDAKTYDEAALNFLAGKGIVSLEEEPDKLVYPGYPVFLALIYKLFGHNYNTVRMIQFLITGITGGLIYIIASHLKFNKFLSFISGLLVVIWPYFIIHSTLIVTETLFSFFITLSAFLLLKFKKNQTNKEAVFLGLSLGAAALIKPEMLLFPFWLLGFLWFFNRFKISKLHILILLSFLLLISPWLIGNLTRFKDFSSEFFLSFKSSWDNAYPEVEKQSDLKYLLKSQVQNFFLFWNPGAGGFRAKELVNKYPWIDILFWSYRALFFLILFGGFLSLRSIKKKWVSLFWVLISYFWAVHTIMYPTPRHTVPIIPLVILLAFLSLKDFCLKKNLLSNLFQGT